MSKARKINIPLVKKLMNETTSLQKKQVNDRIKLAMKIDELIKAKFGTYAHFAKHINRSPTEVSRWISGTHNLTQATLSEIALGLEVELLELFTKKEISRPLVFNFSVKPEETKDNSRVVNPSNISFVHC